MKVQVSKAINIIKSERWTSPLDFRYQDETSEFKMECDRVAAIKRGEVYTPRPWEAFQYLAKEDIGRIHVRGFMHDLVAQNHDGSFTHPAKLSTKEIIERLYPAWNAHAKKFPDLEVNHQRLIFSVSNEYHDVLEKAGLSPNEVLKEAIERSMRALQENHYPGDSIGYSYGLHHDTDNVHAHVFIHPRTRNGKLVGMSGKPEEFKNSESGNKEQLTFLLKSVRHRVTQVLKEVDNINQATHLAQHLNSEKIFFVPRQAHTVRTRENIRSITPGDHLLERKRQSIAALDQLIADKKKSLRVASQGKHIARIFLISQPKWFRQLHKVSTGVHFQEMRALQQKRHRLICDYRAARHRIAPQTKTSTKTVQPYVAKQRLTINPTKSIKVGGFTPTVTRRANEVGLQQRVC